MTGAGRKRSYRKQRISTATLRPCGKPAVSLPIGILMRIWRPGSLPLLLAEDAHHYALLRTASESNTSIHEIPPLQDLVQRSVRLDFGEPVVDLRKQRGIALLHAERNGHPAQRLETIDNARALQRTGRLLSLPNGI